jgi:hypothetical protein
MRLTALTLIGALALAATAVSARAAPVIPPPDADQASGIVKVWGGCGRHWHPVPGHWSHSRGVWVPPHCAPNRPYAGWRHRHHHGWHYHGYGSGYGSGSGYGYRYGYGY